MKMHDFVIDSREKKWIWSWFHVWLRRSRDKIHVKQNLKLYFAMISSDKHYIEV